MKVKNGKKYNIEKKNPNNKEYDENIDYAFIIIQNSLNWFFFNYYQFI